jgi:hypothetical protein
MSFKFKITKTWENPNLGVYHLIGNLEEGSIFPNTPAKVERMDRFRVMINSVSIISYKGEKPNPNEFTLNIDKPDFPLVEIEGQILVGYE